VKAAKDTGVVGLHTAMTARRYEQFDAFDAFKKDFERCQATILLAEPVLRRHQVRLGIENHKGWRSAEQAAWLKRVSSEWVGVHFDFGNNVSLCEDPSQTLANLLPYIFACHIKDMAVEPYEDGFLLSEVPLGEGFLDLKGMVAALQKKDPKTPFDLEMITRDPLKIPVFTSKYWVTFDDSYSPLPGRDLARVLDIVRKNKPKSPLPRTTGMSAEAQMKLEDENVGKSIAWARQNLSL
jgi:sugar phosphate isomerase/epimerase